MVSVRSDAIGLLRPVSLLNLDLKIISENLIMWLKTLYHGANSYCMVNGDKTDVST